MKYTTDSVKLQNFTEQYLHTDVERITAESKQVLTPIFRQFYEASEQSKATMFQTTVQPVYNPEHVPDEIKQTLALCSHNHSVKFNVGKRTVNMSICCPHRLTPAFIRQCVEHAFYMIYVTSKYASSECANDLSVHLYLTNHKKFIGDNEHVLGEINVNTAYTYSCRRTNEVCIFRREEWVKVLAHELFHTLGLDYSHMQDATTDARIKQMFSVPFEIRSFEAYCEIWAEILHPMMLAFLSARRKTNFTSMFHSLERLLRIETRFSMFQCAKVLRHNKMTYGQLLSPNAFREDTSTFAYYILRTLLLYHVNNFIHWCSANNKVLLDFDKTVDNTNRFGDLFKSLYNDRYFIRSLNTAMEVTPRHAFIRDTLRMTAFELDMQPSKKTRRRYTR